MIGITTLSTSITSTVAALLFEGGYNYKLPFRGAAILFVGGYYSRAPIIRRNTVFPQSRKNYEFHRLADDPFFNCTVTTPWASVCG